MKVQLENNRCKITKEAGDKRYTHGYAPPESGLLYDIRKALQAQGYDVLKKRMWRDGHLVDKSQQYIRTRKYYSNPNGFCVYNSMYAIWDAGEKFNSLQPGESLYLAVIR